MRQVRLLRLFLCGLVISVCPLSHAGEVVAEGDPAIIPVVHKPGKFAGRAGTNNMLSNDQKQNFNPQNRSGKSDLQERNSLTKEEKRALRRQVNESVRSYPRRR